MLLKHLTWATFMNACHRPYISWPSPGSLCPRCPLVGVTLFYSLTSEAHPASLPQRVAPTSQLDAAADQPSRVSCLYMATCHLQGTRHASGPCELPPPPQSPPLLYALFAKRGQTSPPSPGWPRGRGAAGGIPAATRQAVLWWSAPHCSTIQLGVQLLNLTPTP